MKLNKNTFCWLPINKSIHYRIKYWYKKKQTTFLERNKNPQHFSQRRRNYIQNQCSSKTLTFQVSYCLTFWLYAAAENNRIKSFFQENLRDKTFHNHGLISNIRCIISYPQETRYHVKVNRSCEKKWKTLNIKTFNECKKIDGSSNIVWKQIWIK